MRAAPHPPGMSSKHRTKPPRRSSRRRERQSRRKRDWAVHVFDGPPLGPDVVNASVDEVMAAVQALPADLNWPDVADLVVPVFPRLRPYPPGMPEPLRIAVPAGMTLGFGIDAGPAFVTVDKALAGRWNVSAHELVGRALANVDRLIAETVPAEVIHSSIGDVAVDWLQSHSGSASTYVLRPRSLARFFGAGNRLVIAPMRNLLLSMPPDVDREFAVWLYQEIAVQDPNCLASIGFLIEDGELTLEPLGEAYGQA
jgi:hypothetical protein